MPSNRMKAWVLHEPGGPDAFRLEERKRPLAKAGHVLIQVEAFGLNRAEHFTRLGQSPGVRFPRVLGIECVGRVVAAPDSNLDEGQQVFAMMGGMGRDFDGSYAQFTVVPRSSVHAFDSSLDWATLGALPEMLQTCYGSLHIGLDLQAGQTILIRGGTSSIGLTTMALAKEHGARVISTTRSESKRAMLLDRGAHEVLIDDGSLVDRIRATNTNGVDGVLDLVGTSSLLDSLKCTKRGGVVCMTGILGGEWELPTFRPMEQIPTGVRLTSYSGTAGDISAGQLQEYLSLIESGELSLQMGPVWQFDQLQEAHELLDSNRANGKMVVLVGAI